MNRAWQIDYTRAEVEVLLTAYWNGGVVDSEIVPVPGMPRSEVNPARLGNSMAHMIDIDRALTRSDLDIATYVGVWLRYGHGLTLDACALGAGVSRPTITEKIDAAVSLLAELINGRSAPIEQRRQRADKGLEDVAQQ